MSFSSCTCRCWFSTIGFMSRWRVCLWNFEKKKSVRQIGVFWYFLPPDFDEVLRRPLAGTSFPKTNCLAKLIACVKFFVPFKIDVWVTVSRSRLMTCLTDLIESSDLSGAVFAFLLVISCEAPSSRTLFSIKWIQ